MVRVFSYGALISDLARDGVLSPGIPMTVLYRESVCLLVARIVLWPECLLRTLALLRVGSSFYLPQRVVLAADDQALLACAFLPQRGVQSLPYVQLRQRALVPRPLFSPALLHGSAALPAHSAKRQVLVLPPQLPARLQSASHRYACAGLLP